VLHRSRIFRFAATVLCAGALVFALGAGGSQSQAGSSHESGLFDPLYPIYEFIQAQFYEPERIDSSKALYSAMKGIVAELADPYSEFLDPEEFSRLSRTIEDGESDVGIGVELGIVDGVLAVIAPLPGSPAEDAGVLPGDLILAINDRSTEFETLSSAKERLRGALEDPVVLWVRHPDDTREEITIVPTAIAVEPMISDVLCDGLIGYVKIQRFESSTPAALDETLSTLEVEKLTGLVLDLRNNPGGLLSVAIAVSSRFVDDGIVSQTVDRFSGQRSHRSTGNLLPNLPLVVLVNRGTAGASEIVAAAIRDNRMGILAGEDTFGLGVYQQLLEFPDGSALRITTGEYLTPSGDPIDGEGIAPDLAAAEGSDVITLAVDWIGQHDGTVMPLAATDPEES